MIDKTRWGTWEEWVAEGYGIIKGSKATRINGKPMFSETQVIKLKTGGRGYDTRAWQYDEDWNELDSWTKDEY